jgi:regulator of cell morphogenesis and NO signaling
MDERTLMTTITRQSTLGGIVNVDPALAGLLERRGLDYCCGGSRTIEEACADAGIDAATVVDELTAAQEEVPDVAWARMDAAELVDHIEGTHHRYLWDELPRLTALMDKVYSVHGARHPELGEISARLADLRSELEPHLVKEERVLFPTIRELATATSAPSFHCGSLRNPISVMLSEHDRAGELLATLRQLTSGYTPPADGCASYTALFRGLGELEADTHLHVHKENNVLFPMVEQLEVRLAS